MSQGFVFKAVERAVIENAFRNALKAEAVQEQILTDCNTYIKHLEGTLEDSVQFSVKKLTLTLTWDTPYAKRQWYTGAPSATSLSFHPKASIKWAEKAEAEYGDDWQEILKKEMKDNL